MSTFTVTERGSFKRCRRSWYWGSFNGEAIQLALPPTALSTGTIWHKAMELWALDGMEQGDGRPRSRLVDCASLAYVQVVQEIEDGSPDGLSTEGRYQLSEQWELLENMAINYEGFWKTPLEDGYIMIQPEQTVVIDVPGSPHKLEATLDGLIKNQRNGLAYVLEHKTYGNRPNEESLQFGDQYLAYLWVLQQLGFRCGGVAYDGAWKRPSPPRGKTVDDLFLRFIITRSSHELEEFAAFLPQELADMEAARLDPSLRYFNRRWEGCHDCGFRSICQATSRGEMVDTSSYAPRKSRERAAIWPTIASNE